MIATLACVAHPAKLGPEDGGAVRLACTACAKLTAQTGANSLVQHLEECKKIARQSVLLGARGPSLTLVRFLKTGLRERGLVLGKTGLVPRRSLTSAAGRTCEQRLLLAAARFDERMLKGG
jgi:hypothetical protein